MIEMSVIQGCWCVGSFAVGMIITGLVARQENVGRQAREMVKEAQKIIKDIREEQA